MRYEWGLGIGHVYSWKNDQVAGGASVGPLDIEEPELDEVVDANSVAEDNLAEDCLDNGENEVLSEGKLNEDEEGEDHDWVDEEEGSDNEGNHC